MDLIILAAGAGKRFGGRKLFADINGHRLYEHMYNIYERAYNFNKKIIVTGESEIRDFYNKRGFITLCNNEPEMGKSLSIIMAIKKLKSLEHISENVMFGVCDQPLLNPGTLTSFIDNFNKSDKSIASLRHNNRMGNPCIFSSKWYNSLINLSKDQGGKKIIKENLQEVLFVDIKDGDELLDMDTMNSYDMILRLVLKKAN